MTVLDSVQSISLAIRDRPLEQILLMGESVDRGQRLALFWADMRSRWRSGQQVTAEDYLSAHRSEDEEFIVDLIYAEYVLREEFNSPLDLETYGLRFPDQFSAFKRQIPIHEGLRDLGLSMTDTIPADITAKPADLHRIGKYVIVAKIGSGGQCDVYRAVHPDLGSEVAIKIGRPAEGSDLVLLETLRREGRILSELRHPHLARVFDLDVHEGRPFLVLEYVRGLNLLQFATQHPPTPRAAAQTIANVARALSVVHRAGLVHGDCKPNNIVMDQEGQPRLIDFGLSWRCDAWSGNESTATSAISGTLGFMSPEQVAGVATSIDHRSDVFNLGGTLFFLLTGKAPYQARELQEALRMVRRCQWDRAALQAANVPASLKRICRRAMASAPDQRYESIDQMAADLDRVVSPRSLQRWASWILLGVAVMLGAVWMLSGWLEKKPPQPQPPQAQPLVNALAIAEAAPLDLKINVWEDERTLQLPDVVPLHSGDALQIQFNVPAGRHAALFLLNSQGEWSELMRRQPAQSMQRLRYPARATEVVPLTGLVGTELILACVSTEPISTTDLPGIVDPPENWPRLLATSVLHVDRTGVVVEQRARDLGPALEMVTPESKVTQQLETLNRKLSERDLIFEGIAFAHVD